ncbi:MAG TPA: GAF domain-containing protein [Amycolatopsis sp.]|nr:GAF domain-containing protein [Amycolatopsis sp.]
MRAEVAASWQRSAAAGVPADGASVPITLDSSDLGTARSAHPLATVFPLLDDVLGQTARECDAIMAVADAAGQLLWVCGSSTALRRADGIGFVPGSNWDERLVGTNAPGLALRLDQPSTVIRAEHFRQSVQNWSCAAAPIHDPATSELLGVLDVTGGDEIVVPQTMALIRATVRLAETELARGRLMPPALEGSTSYARVHLDALGRGEALITIDDARGHTGRLRLSPRHSELLVLLASAPEGLSGDELAVLLYEDDSGSSTLRVELNRLRRLLGDDLLASRPYRLNADVATDWFGVEARLTSGDTAGAVRRFRGPLLPRSTAPGVVRLREALTHQLRTAVLASARADLMSAWTRSAWGSDDYEVWARQCELLPQDSPLWTLARGQLARLDRELGT